MGKLTKRAINNLTLPDFGWNQKHSLSFDGIQEQLHNVVKSAHRNPALRICIYSDASDKNWASAVTQCEEHELNSISE